MIRRLCTFLSALLVFGATSLTGGVPADAAITPSSTTATLDDTDGQAVNLLSYRGPTLGSRQRIQNVVATWQRTMTSTLLNEFRVGYNKFASSRSPPSGPGTSCWRRLRLSSETSRTSGWC